MNTWVEYYKFTDKRNNNHAKMKENAKWVDPDPSIIQRRFFDKPEDARNFANSMGEQGYMVSVKQDGLSNFNRFNCEPA